MLDSVNIGDDSKKENLQLVKMQVLDMAERFDMIEETQRNQSIMLSYLVQSHNTKMNEPRGSEITQMSDHMKSGLEANMPQIIEEVEEDISFNNDAEDDDESVD